MKSSLLPNLLAIFKIYVLKLNKKIYLFLVITFILRADAKIFCVLLNVCVLHFAQNMFLKQIRIMIYSFILTDRVTVTCRLNEVFIFFLYFVAVYVELFQICIQNLVS